MSGTSLRVYVSYANSSRSMSVQVCDTEGYYDVIEASDDNSYHGGCQGALLCYRRGYYQKAMELLNDYIDKDEELGHPFGELSAEDGLSICTRRMVILFT